MTLYWMTELRRKYKISRDKTNKQASKSEDSKQIVHFIEPELKISSWESKT